MVQRTRSEVPGRNGNGTRTGNAAERRKAIAEALELLESRATSRELAELLAECRTALLDGPEGKLPRHLRAYLPSLAS